MNMFPTKKPLESVSVCLLGPLPKSNAENHLILLMADRFTKMKHIIPLKRTTNLYVAKAFSWHCVFNYGSPNEVLSDNGLQFASSLYQNTCWILGISITFTSVYHQQKTIQVKFFNRSITAILLFYVSDHPDNWDEYVKPFKHIQPQRSSRHRKTLFLPHFVSPAPLFYPLLLRIRTSSYRERPYRLRGTSTEGDRQSLHVPRQTSDVLQVRFRLARSEIQQPSNRWRIDLPRPIRHNIHAFWR